MANGPMMVGFVVYSDFFNYKTGIYKPTTNSISGGHAVKLIGWGTDTSSVPSKLYWICQN